MRHKPMMNLGMIAALLGAITLGRATAVEITSVDHSALPAGETMALTGSGFSDPTAVTFLNFIDAAAATAFDSASDDALNVTFPDLEFTDYQILIETSSGSTVTPGIKPGRTPSTIIGEFTGNGPVPDPTQPEATLIIRAGAVASSVPDSAFAMIYVEAGAVLQGVADDGNYRIFAEDGATLDFRSNDFTSAFQPPSVFYSSGTTILGTLPESSPANGSNTIVRQVTPLSFSTGVGSFSRAIRINVDIVGPGTVSSDTGNFFAPRGSTVTLTASPSGTATFTSWSGAASSTDPILQISIVGTSDLDLTATFSQGFDLETFTGGRGAISADPDLSSYADGQVATLTATPAAGFEFVAWGGALAGVTDAIAPITFDSHKAVIAIFRPLTPPSPTQITAADFYALPLGETSTLTGTGFSNPSAVTFLSAAGSAAAPGFDSASDDALTVTFPDLDFGDTQVLVETSTGSTVTPGIKPGRTPSSLIGEFTGNGPVPDPTQREASLIIRAGAVASAVPDSAYAMIYVEAGAVLQGVADDAYYRIFAEDGATLDFRSNDFTSAFQPPSVFYSSGTTILGSLPESSPGNGSNTIVRQVTPLSFSTGVGSFSRAYSLDIQIKGSGTVSVSPEKSFYVRAEAVNVTATPAEGSFFIRWSGSVNSTQAAQSFSIQDGHKLIARFSDRPDFFTDWRTRFFTQAELADPTISGLDADPDADGYTNSTEYAFGSNPTVSEPGRALNIRMAEQVEEGASILIDYFRPLNAVDITYQLRASTTLGDWQDGISGDLLFTFVETETVDLNDDIEKVTIAVTFPYGLPDSAYFQLNANIEDIN